MALASSNPPSPRPRRVPTPSWLDLRLVLGVVLVIGSVLIGAKIVSGASHTYPTVAARRNLAQGTIVTAGDVRLAQVQLPEHGAGVYLAHLEDVVGKRLSRAISSGELVPAAAVGEVPAQTTVTVPLESGAAPDLRPGQRIELWVSAAACDSVVLLPAVTVQAVHTDTGGSFSSGDGGQNVVISVSPELADRVISALALEDAKLRAGILVGPSGGGQAEASLVDLSTCSSPAAGR